MRDPLAPYEPTAADPFDLPKVGHLLRRAGFGAPLRVRRELVDAGPDVAVARVFGDGVAEDGPARAAELHAVVAFGEIERVRAFRVMRALRAEHPLHERVAYFWHGHFATSDAKVADPRAMALQMDVFDRLGTGRFDDLVLAMCRDPAMLRWLDNETNTKEQPNENFARELFELFTLGRGNYDEHDVRDAARCFTGWHVHEGVFRFQARLHDGGTKRLFGAAVESGEDVVAATVVRRESAEFLATKWLRFFVHPEPEASEVAALADEYRRRDRNVGATLRTLLRSRLFFSPRAWRSKVKSPADFVLGTVRCLGARAAPAFLARSMAAMGEAWLAPPSVEGWHTERAWLSPASWLVRSNFVADLLARRAGKLEPAPGALFTGLSSPRDRARAALLALLDGAAGDEAVESVAAVARAHAADEPDAAAAAVLHAVACLPEYQLS